nr:immunoglobulin heavy chain junction region [Macaca mulatta]MOV39313.1 immunoglobulin heavy chain junction region [Macaca mulatta]MOV39829.1 immunoglobulin heavy chain junction region [Macaca mulatta]MOV45447.1 immunoglobulin heavy chain junction region [Macaca mulatta]MOV46666.1 immunoglobulin heavy chain junction region [Macaca mulatta]
CASKWGDYRNSLDVW